MKPVLGFSSEWFAAGVMTLGSLADYERYAAADPTKPPQHWRWLAFRDFAEERVPLNDDQCRVLFHLGEREPDANLATAMMCSVLYQSACPADVWAKAAASERAAVRRLSVRRNSVAVRASAPKPRPSA